jgi:hypothetical protein
LNPFFHKIPPQEMDHKMPDRGGILWRKQIGSEDSPKWLEFYLNSRFYEIYSKLFLSIKPVQDGWF